MLWTTAAFRFLGRGRLTRWGRSSRWERTWGQGDTDGTHDVGRGAGGLGAQGPLLAGGFDPRRLEPVEVTQDVAPFRLDAQILAAGLELLAQHEREERAENVGPPASS